MDKHILTRYGLFDAQICSEGTYDEALDWVRRTNPAGTKQNWVKHDQGDFAPIQCEKYPNRKHYMFEC